MTKKRSGPASATSIPKAQPALSWHVIITSKWVVPLILVLAFGILLATRQISDADIGFHLRGGQWMLENMKFHSRDVFTYTVTGNEYIAMYWLYQIVLYGIFYFSGYGGLTLFNVLLITLVLLLILWRMKSSGVPIWLSVFAIFATILAIEFRFLYRPEIITWIMLLLTLILFDQYYYRSRNLLYLLPVIELVWVNFHGLFILGWFVAVAYFISIWIHRRSLDRQLLKWSALSIAASFINPYFLKGISFPFYLFTRLQGSNIFKPMISEFQSPWTIKTMGAGSLFLTSPLHWYYVVGITSLLLLVLTYRKRQIHEYLLWVAFFYLSASVARNVPLFMIVAIHITAVSARDIARWIRPRAKRLRFGRSISRATVIVFSFLIILLGSRVITNSYYLDNNRAVNFGIGLDRSAHPIGAADFLKQHNLEARLLNDLSTGSWFIWQIPQPVFIDGRLEVMKEDFFQVYLSSYANHGLENIINRYHPRLIVFDHAAALNWRRQILDLPGWFMIYLDDKSVIYAQEGYAPQQLRFRFPELLTQRGVDTMPTDTEVWQILQKKPRSGLARFMEGFTKKRHYADLLPMNLALFAYGIGELRAAELLLLDIMRNSVYYSYDMHFNLGAIYYRSGEYEKALYCYTRVLQLDPENPYAQKYINSLNRLIQERNQL
jgi:tetratricopeptide (TPR) repeat protein